MLTEETIHVLYIVHPLSNKHNYVPTLKCLPWKKCRGGEWRLHRFQIKYPRIKGEIFSHFVYVYLHEVLSPEADLRPRPSMHTHNRNGRRAQVGPPAERYGTMDRTSAQPQANLSFLRRNSLKLKPMGGGMSGSVTPPSPTPFYNRYLDLYNIFNDTNVFTSN
jgi:hypothetical protein